MFEPRSLDPLEFARIHVKVDAREMRRARDRNCLDRTVKEIYRHAGVPQRDVFLHSTIGNSIVELYVPALARDYIAGSLKMKGVPVEDSFDPTQVPTYGRITQEEAKDFIVRRLAFLYRRARLVRLKACVLSGFNEEICEAVKEAVNNPTPAEMAGATLIDNRQ
jgi:hypothetical protein